MSRLEDAVSHGMVPADWTGCSGEHLVGPGELLEVARWCYATYGKRGWMRMSYDFWFERPEDATLFRLRWS